MAFGSLIDDLYILPQVSTTTFRTTHLVGLPAREQANPGVGA
jgi:hypothetical protein